MKNVQDCDDHGRGDGSRRLPAHAGCPDSASPTRKRRKPGPRRGPEASPWPARTTRRSSTCTTARGSSWPRSNERDFYNQPVISPDKTRIAVIKNHPETETQDAWVIDVATGKGTRITTASQPRELSRAPVWSPDGKQLAYVSLRAGTEGLYRKAANGEGPEELLYKHPGFGMNLMGWSLDGRYLSYFTADLSGGILYLLPLEGAGERKPIEAFRSTSTVQGARLSPDSRFLSYMSNQSGRPEMYVRPVDASGNGAADRRAMADIHRRWPGHGFLAAGRQGVLLPGRRSGIHGGRREHLPDVRIRQTETAVPPARGAGCERRDRKRQPRRRAIRGGRARHTEASADHRVRPPGEDPEQARGAWQLWPAEPLARWRTRRGHAQRSQDESARHLDVRRRDRQGDTR